MYRGPRFLRPGVVENCTAGGAASRGTAPLCARRDLAIVALVDSQVPAFAAAGRAGLLDFWAVYARVIAALQGADDVCGLPEAVAQSPEGAALVAQVNAVRGLLGRAIVDGEWAAFIAHARELGARYATL